MKKEKQAKISRELLLSDYNLASLLKDLGVHNLNLISCGNSIASGYSANSLTIPLLERNTKLEQVLSNEGITLKKYHFARAEDNCCEHTLGYLVNDTSLADIHKLNRFDAKEMNMELSDEELDSYYPIDEEALTTTINTILDNKDASNIIIYNGGTGSFLDNVSRGGKLSHKLVHGIKRDMASIKGFLSYIQEKNRNGDNTQVYLCGAPRLLGLSSLFINLRLRKIAKSYANVTYVKPIRRKIIYKWRDGKVLPDLHYDGNEYLKFNTSLITHIANNYVSNKMNIELDRSLFRLNRDYQMGRITKKDLETSSICDINEAVLYNTEGITGSGLSLDRELSKSKKYLLDRTPYDYFYVGKDTIKKGLIKK